MTNSNLDYPHTHHLMVIGKSDSIVNLLTLSVKKKLDPVVILGSQFPDDRHDYSYSVLNKIMVIYFFYFTSFFCPNLFITYINIILLFRCVLKQVDY